MNTCGNTPVYYNHDMEDYIMIIEICHNIACTSLTIDCMQFIEYCNSLLLDCLHGNFKILGYHAYITFNIWTVN